MWRPMYHLFSLVGILLLFAACNQSHIDRKVLVDRHRIVTAKTNPVSPAQVGNGEFAFGVDITGLQTFVPFNTMAQWSWHSFPLPEGKHVEDFEKPVIDTYGKPVPYDIPNPRQPELSNWLAANPHRFNLGRIGFRLLRPDGSEAVAEDLSDTRQEVDMWTGIIHSFFILDGIPVSVKTACHPSLDAVGVTVESQLVREGKLTVFLDFPYAEDGQMKDYVGTYDRPEAHRSVIKEQKDKTVSIAREMDDVSYYTSLHWDTPASFIKSGADSSHRFELRPENTEKLSFTCLFSRKKADDIPVVADVFDESAREWQSFWQSGAVIDLSGSKDPRWIELERRIVLSQYLMKVNEAGSLPPQESGLVNNGWYGRFHFEMIWWHGVHYALWNRWPLLEKSLTVYQNYLSTSRERAGRQGYKGARWPKCTADFDREWPHIIHATLIWQQPHPIYFADLDYRLHPTRETLEKWEPIITATADFMADYAYYDEAQDRYVLGPPVFIVSENTVPETTINPAFELGYWRYGLRMAAEWRKRLSLPVDAKWEDVLAKLASLPVEDGLYVTHEGIRNMWSDFAFEHPALIGTYGMLPGDGVNAEILARTLDKITSTWNFDRTWGWDFPMLAMAAARCGKPEQAVDFLLHPAGGFQFDEHGLATGGPFPYLPSNGALLTAVAMMAAGWDGSTGETPGFPCDGSWVVKTEGFLPMP
ncbi:hypothetical protein NBH15_03090 [Parabacteroides sp. W1-Q-101]|uniref:hypothetical protein n=1 Tax=Parabacteroides caeci TaxID=2949650 RepID=UPI00202F9AE0|nr:hypothetical protein [Parabacteroides sp. W1-Q-101]MCM0717255.1 hypothetical protein [Parabacteroides sp. W1-Q-101]